MVGMLMSIGLVRNRYASSSHSRAAAVS
jgi:hypothetical protein